MRRAHSYAHRGAAVGDGTSTTAALPPDIQYDLRLQELADLAEEFEALEHFEELRREADERAW